MAWHRAASVDEVMEGTPLGVTVGDKSIGLYRVDGQIYAIEDICPHQFALLSSGYLEGDAIECPLHQALFHIPTGKCLLPPADRDLETYSIRLDGNDILVDLP